MEGELLRRPPARTRPAPATALILSVQRPRRPIWQIAVACYHIRGTLWVTKCDGRSGGYR